MRAGQKKQLRLIAPNTVFSYFMKLGQKNGKVAHRANPAINFLNLTSKVTAAYQIFLNAEIIFGAFTIAPLV